MIVPNLTFVYDRKGRAGKSNPASVELRVYADKKQRYITTGVKLLPKEWSIKAQEVNACRPDYMELNDQLHAFKKKASECVALMISQGNLDLGVLPAMLAEEITQQTTFLNFAKAKAAKHIGSLARGTQKRYKVVFDFLEAWVCNKWPASLRLTKAYL